ncbi:MAG TPA: hypothetical protein VHR72_03065, partial [Gemmataceae bacterium]|nr:hypothetical protein [Gemmataceae bacterium]
DPNAADAVVVAAFGATTELVQPAGLVFGISQGDTNNLYVANSPLGEVDKITGATGPTPVLTTFVPAGAGAGAPYVIPGQNPGDPPLTQPYSGLSFPAGLAFGPDGKLYVSDLAAVTNDGNVLRINSDGSVDSVVFAQMNASQQGTLHEQFPYGLQFDDQGNLLTADLGANQNVPLPGSINEYAPNGAFVKTLVSPASFPMGIAPGTAILDMPRQTTVYVASDNFGLTGQLTYGATIPASPETGGQQAVFGVNAFSSITAALDAMSTTGTVIVNGGGYVDSPTLIGAETLRLLGNVTLFDIDTNAGTTVDLQGNTLTMIGKNNGSHTVAGSIKGIGGSLMKVGNDPLTLNGANTYTGPTAVANGALIVNGSLSASSTVSITGNGILGGTGFVGKVINNGVVNPGSPGAPGILTIAGDLTFGPGTLVLDLAANGSDRVNDTGPTIDITGTTLSLNVGTITPNEKFTILVTPGDITGRFANLPTTGSSFTVGSLTFTINYDAGVGDDATVTLQASGGNPSLVGTLLNGGINYVNSALATHQHSMVENVVYSFTQAVSLSASNFTLSGIQGTPPSLVPNVSVSGSGMLWTVSFTGAGVNAATNSIADGEFELVLSGVAGMATSTYDFFRLLGDMDGNGTVDTSDFATLVSTFLRASTDPLYLGADDFDGDNTIGTSDFAEFTGNFLKTLPAPLPN